MPYKDKNQQREFNRIWIAKRRSEWLQEHGPCVKCGSWDDLNVDHVDPELKIDHKVWSWSNERRETELAKCQVLCHLCHLEKTKKDMNYTLIHGTVNGYKKYKCRCFLCVEASKKKNRLLTDKRRLDRHAKKMEKQKFL